MVNREYQPLTDLLERGIPKDRRHTEDAYRRVVGSEKNRKGILCSTASATYWLNTTRLGASCWSTVCVLADAE